MNLARHCTQSRICSQVFDPLFAGVKIAHSSRRENDSRLFFALKNSQVREPKSTNRDAPEENRHSHDKPFPRFSET